MAERRKAGGGMTRPELAVLMAYAKRSLKQALLHSSLPDDPYLEHELEGYFPAAVVERFGYLLGVHPLKRELIATIVANDVVNSEGVTFVSRLMAETGAEAADVARAYRIAREVTGATPLWDEVEALDGTIDPVLQNELMVGVDWLVERVARWYLASASGADIGEAIAAGREGFAEVAATIRSAGTDSWRTAHEAVAEPFVAAGVSEELARRHAYVPELVHAPDIVVVARQTGRPLPEVARVFYLLGEALHLDWLESRLDDLPTVSRWQRWAIQAIEDDLTLVRREIAQRVIESSPEATADEAVTAYLAARPEASDRLSRFMRGLALEGVTDLAVLTVAVRQIRGLTT
jgi:glutamate dehydrogenase